MATASDSIQISNSSASVATALMGGVYVLTATATFGGGSVKVQALALDGSTLVDVTNGSLSAAGTTGALYLPPGVYKITITTATAVYAALTRVPVG